MLATIIISLLAILFAWLARFQKSKYGGLEVAFILLTVFMSIRYNFGNDYPGYLEDFLRVGNYSNLDFSFEHSELGWLILLKVFQPIGFFGMIIVLTVFEYVVIYRLIKKHVPKDWYWLSVFIFTLNTGYMLVFGSMMRQFLAMCIFLVAVEFIIKKRLLISILLVILASLFHTSALVMLPFCFFGYLDISLSNRTALIWFSSYILLYFFAAELLGEYFFKFLELEQFQRYETYIGGNKTALSSGLGAVFLFILYAVLLFHQRCQTKSMKIIFILFSFNVIFSMFADIAPLVGRLGYYLSVLSIVCYPLMFKAIKNKIWRYALLAGYIIITLKGFNDFFDPSGIWYDSFYTYQTIFSANFWM